MTLWQKVLAAVVAALALVAVGCGGEESEAPKRIVLVTHDSFVIPDDLKRTFQRRTGRRLRILQTGDAGETLTKALLTAGNPQGDVLFGIDSNLLSRALAADLLVPYSSPRLARVQKRFMLDPQHRALPVDHGEVCVNYDRAFFEALDVAPPRSLDDIADPTYQGLLVVENPATSTPGLAFLLATIAKYGEDGWQDYWRRLRENDVLVVDGWEEAYNVRFSGSGAGRGDRPLVVSYASSPPAEVIFRTPRPRQAPTGVIEDSCFRQVEFVGILRGTENEEGARELIDFMLSQRFQEEVPLSMFVFPVISGARLPPEFRRFAVVPDNPLELPPKKIEANRDRWVKEWTSTVLR